MVKRPALQSFYRNATLEAGCDEAGRGCLAGPVVAAAVILPPDFSHQRLNDSKQMSERDRLEVRAAVLETAVAWGIALCSPEEIDRINILKASILAMHRALTQLKVRPELILVDGNRFLPYDSIPYICMIKGDSRFASIAAASVLAKTERDAMMTRLHAQYPFYGWDKNKGYPTSDHRKLLSVHGPSPCHRESFRGVKRDPELPLL